jgi:hypothetical protein
MPLCPTTEDTIQHRRKRVPQGLKSNVPLYSSLDITTNMKKKSLYYRNRMMKLVPVKWAFGM